MAGGLTGGLTGALADGLAGGSSGGVAGAAWAALVAGLVVAGVLVWPGRPRPVGVALPRAPAETPPPGPRAGTWWHTDPLEAYRRRTARLEGEVFEAALLALLDAIGAALRAGLPPARALELAATTLPGEAPVELDTIVLATAAASRDGLPVAPVWREVADRGRSPVVHAVAAAWGLSESTGCPLAEAVERAAAELRTALTTRRKVRSAVAGPQATVTVLTVLPLTGPLFGLACGVGPGQLYGSPLGAGSLGAGLVLLWIGRRWCRSLVRRAEQPR